MNYPNTATAGDEALDDPDDFGAQADARGLPHAPGWGQKLFLSYRGIKVDQPVKAIALALYRARVIAYLSLKGKQGAIARWLSDGTLSRVAAASSTFPLSPSALASALSVNGGGLSDLEYAHGISP